MKHLLLIQILISLFFLGCSHSEEIKPEINYKGFAYIKIETSNLHDSIYFELKRIHQFPIERVMRSALITNNGVLFIEQDLSKPELFEFSINLKDRFKTYLIPNDTITININQHAIDSEHYTTTYTCDNAIFKYLQTKNKTLGYVDLREYWFRMNNSGNNYNKGAKAADSLAKVNESFMNKYSGQLPQWFINLEKSNIQYSSAHCKLLLFGMQPTNMDQKMELNVDVPLYNPKAIFSDSYYSFLKLYFTYGYRLKNPEYGYILTKEASRIKASLKNEIRDYFITGIMAELFLNCLSGGEFKIIDSLYALNDFKLSPKQLEYIGHRKSDYLERDKPEISLYPKNCAPDFEIRDVNGDIHKLSDLKGKMIYLHFWATWCGPCLSEIPALNEFANKVDPEKILIVNVCLDNELYKVKKIITEKKLAGLNLICDEKSYKQISKLYNISSIPHYALIDENGLIIKNHCNRPNDIYDYITLLDKDRGKL